MSPDDPSNPPGETSEPAEQPDKPAAEPAEPEKPADPAEQARLEMARLKDQLLRTAADFDNYRKRSRREIDDASKRAREELLKDLLPVFDNLERAVVHAGQAQDAKSVADGVRMVLKQFVDTLGRAGITRIEAVGKPFDPAVHEAIQQIETADQPPGTVVAEVQPGYSLGDRLVRAAMVVVAKPKSSGNGEEPPNPEPN